MFSEYASKFLQQSQSRMSAIRDGRLNPQTQAPLFHSAADFLPEDPEREQEVQDYYTLQSSRRHFEPFGSGSLDEGDEDGEGEYSDDDSTEELRRSRGTSRGRPSGSGQIKSSWRQSKPSKSASSSRTESVFSDRTATRDKGKGKLVDVDLNASRISERDMEHSEMQDSVPFYGFAPRKISSDEEDDGNPPADLITEHRYDNEDEPSSSFQNFKTGRESPSLPFASSPRRKDEEEPFMKKDTPPRRRPVPEPSSISDQTLPTAAHDHIWGTLYMLLMCVFFSVAFVVWLHTDATEIPGTDTIYRTLHQSMGLLLFQTFVAVGVALLWMYLLRSFVKPFVYILLVAVPITMFVLSIYAFAMSFKAKRYTGQDRVMRWGSVVPAIVSGTWVYAAWKGRNAMHRAVGIVQLSCKILGDNPALVMLSFVTLITTCLVTWVWVGMFTRAFLTGTMLVRGHWIWSLNSTSVALAIFYIIMYLWTLGIISNLHRATSSATVSQWYFHRHTIPRLSSAQIARAAFSHSTTTIFGTLSFHSFLSLLVRLPLIIAPRRLASLIHLVCFQFIASPIAALISPLTLTFAAIHSQPLVASSRAVTSLAFLENINPSALKNRQQNRRNGSGSAPVPVQAQEKRNAYRLAKMMLTAARGVTAAALGMAAWIQARGSVYGYLVGLIGGTIGWAVLGATEGCLGNVVDAVLVCVATEEGAGSVGTCCREAQLVFGG